MRTLALPKHALALALLAGSLGLQAHAQSQYSNKSVPAAQAPLTAQERLDAIRQSLVDASLQTPTRVSTTTWLDPQGSLRENTRFQNVIKRVLFVAISILRTGKGNCRRGRANGHKVGKWRDIVDAGRGLCTDPSNGTRLKHFRHEGIHGTY